MNLLCSDQLQEIENACGSLITDILKTHGFGTHYCIITNVITMFIQYFSTYVPGTCTEALLLDRKSDEE